MKETDLTKRSGVKQREVAELNEGKTVTYDYTLSESYLRDFPLDDLIMKLKCAALNLSNSALTTDLYKRALLILEVQSAIFDVTEFLDLIIVKEVQQ